MIWFIFLTVCLHSVEPRSIYRNRHFSRFFPENVDPEIYQNATEIIRSKGFEAEEHYLATDDNYILCMIRILPKKRIFGSPRVVLLQHGLLDSCHTWINNHPNQSLGFILAENGYDVWLPNSRGTTYSTRHKYLLPTQKEFWEFSWDHMAKYDFPAQIDYIIQKTGVSNLSYVGHSQGTLIAFARLSQDVKLQSRLNIMVALAPVAYLGSIRSPIRYLAPFAERSQQAFEWLGNGKFLPSNKVMKFLAQFLCDTGHVPYVCSNILFLIAGYDKRNTNQTRLPVYIAHTPAGTSVQNMIHYCQAILNNHFQMYDYGSIENMNVYGQMTPPFYNLSNFRVRTAIYYGGNDWLSTPQDVGEIMKDIAKTVVSITYLPSYNHLDFVWGLNAAQVLYPSILRQLSLI